MARQHATTMYLQRLLQINLATLAGLATLLLSMGEDNPSKALLVWLAAGASIWLTDVRGWLRLNRTTASAAALLLGAWFAVRWMRVGGDARILVLADLVVYLQLILFFQKKDRSVYWLLAIISLLEVVVAAWLSHGAMFGVLLVIYMLTGLSALALLFLHSQWSRYQRGAAPPRPPAGQPLAAAGRPIRLHHQRGGQQPRGHRRRTVPAAGHAGDWAPWS